MGQLSGPCGLALDPVAKELFIADHHNHRVVSVFAPCTQRALVLPFCFHLALRLRLRLRLLLRLLLLLFFLSSADSGLTVTDL